MSSCPNQSCWTFRAGLLHHPAAATAAAGSLDRTAIPQFQSILMWLGAVLDAHMVSLAMHPSCHEVRP